MPRVGRRPGVAINQCARRHGEIGGARVHSSAERLPAAVPLAFHRQSDPDVDRLRDRHLDQAERDVAWVAGGAYRHLVDRDARNVRFQRDGPDAGGIAGRDRLMRVDGGRGE